MKPFKILKYFNNPKKEKTEKKFQFKLIIYEPYFDNNIFYCNQIRILNHDWIYVQLDRKHKFANELPETDLVLLTTKFEETKFSDLNLNYSIVIGGAIYLGNKKVEEVPEDDLDKNIEYIFEANIYHVKL